MTTIVFGPQKKKTTPQQGVLISHATMVSALSGFAMIFAVKGDDFYLNYLPLAHVLALTIENAALHKGVPIGYGVCFPLIYLLIFLFFALQLILFFFF